MSARIPGTLCVAICTRNRRDPLLRALDAVERAAAHPRAPAVEVLVVDNGSGDGTAAALARREGANAPRVLCEPRVGLSRARNTAMKAFRSDWIIFTDDDAEVSEAWLVAIAEAIERHRQMRFFGGRTLVRWTTPPPAWLTDPDLPYIQGLLCHLDLGDDDLPMVSEADLPFGVNMGVHRDVVSSIAPMREDLGPGAGTRGEETEFLARALAAGHAGWYLGQAVVHHHADPGRMHLLALYRHGIAKGAGHARVHGRGGSMTAELRHLLLATAMGLRGKPDWMRVCLVNAGMQRGLRQHARRR